MHYGIWDHESSPEESLVVRKRGIIGYSPTARHYKERWCKKCKARGYFHWLESYERTCSVCKEREAHEKLMEKLLVNPKRSVLCMK